MQRSSKIILITLIVLITLTIIGVLLASLELLYRQADHSAPVVTETTTNATAVASELVILHSEPVAVDRFGMTLTLQAHHKINNKAINTTVAITPPGATTTEVHFSAVGEVIETERYRFRIVNATDQTVQLMVLQLTTED